MKRLFFGRVFFRNYTTVLLTDRGNYFAGSQELCIIEKGTAKQKHRFFSYCEYFIKMDIVKICLALRS